MTVKTLGSWIVELSQEPGKVQREASEVVRATGFLCQRVGQQFAPVDTGFLRSSITVGNPEGGSVRPGDLTVQVGPEAAYGAFVEYGTARAGAQPYMTPASEQAGEWFVTTMASKVGLR